MQESAVPDLEAWDAWRPRELAVRLRPLKVPWAVAGGWALDLFVADEPRSHPDIEIVVARGSLAAVQAALPELAWFGVVEGQVTPFLDTPGDVHQTWGWDRSRECWRVDVIREPWEDDWWVYRRNPAIRRPLAEAIEQTVDGTPYLAPEIVLLFKAKAPREKDESDLARLLPLMSDARKAWLARAVEAGHPRHRWLASLAA